MIQEFLNNHSWIIDVFTIIGAFRVIFKPIMTMLLKYVKLTVSVEDDKLLAKFMKSKVYLMLDFLLDLTASIKMPKINRK